VQLISGGAGVAPNTVKHTNSEGQALILLAAMLFCIVLVSLVVIQIRRAYQAANYVEEVTNAAVEAAIQPLANTVLTGDIAIDKDTAREQILTDIAQNAYFAARDYGLTTADLTDDLQIEIINPPSDPCQFTGETVCYESPAVKVTATVTVKIFGLAIKLQRTARGTLGAVAGATEAVPTIAIPTPMALPTEAFIGTKVPTP